MVCAYCCKKTTICSATQKDQLFSYIKALPTIAIAIAMNLNTNAIAMREKKRKKKEKGR
jgi:hypothetical protein